tara:strand:+ start:10215 stop:10613 length:399 start_codon:yes stop_codon:yes gene_type:complete
MSKNKWITYKDENGKRYMQCKMCQSDYVLTSDDAIAVTCSLCVAKQSIRLNPELLPELRDKPSGRPPGWHFMTEFVDKDGIVFHKGIEQPDLKGTLSPTKVKPRKKKKKNKLTADEKLFKLAKQYKNRKKNK